MVLEDDWNLVVFEDEVERAKTQGCIKDLVKKSENSAFSTPEKKFLGVLARYTMSYQMPHLPKPSAKSEKLGKTGFRAI